MASSTPDSTPVTDANKKCNSIPKSRFLKTVCLSDWWLVKPESGGGLSVSGFTSREQRAMRVFSSAPILKDHDVFTLETTDGMFVLIEGLINKVRTSENGFPSDVFNHFVFGFPPYWKDYTENCMGGKTPEQAEAGRKAETISSMDDAVYKGTRSQSRHGATGNLKTPGFDMEGVLSGSSKSLSLSRSRSGRLLMPVLKFWSNERALYDAEGNITGIEDETVPKHSVKGKDGKPQRRRRQLT